MARENDLFYRDIEWERSGLNEEKRTDIISFSSETEEVERWFGIEILDHSSKAVNLKRLRSVGAFHFNHNSDRIIGPIYEVKIENSRGIARVGYDETEEGELALKRRKSGSLKGTSFGYRVKTFKELTEGEEYTLSGGKTIKGRRDIRIMIATRWEPVEITATSLPFDITVGLGRCLTRSLDGIDIEKSINPNKREESTLPDEKDIQRIVDESIKKALPEVIKSVLPEIRSILTEEQKPQMRMEMAIAQDLTNRASAISQECEVAVSRMIFHGKTEQEVTRFILDKAIGKTDAEDNGGPGGDPTKRLIDDKNKQSNQIGQIRSFKQIGDDQFFATILNPAQLPM